MSNNVLLYLFYEKIIYLFNILFKKTNKNLNFNFIIKYLIIVFI